MTSRYKDQLNDPQMNRLSRPVEEYKNVSVLLLQWETSDMDGIDKEIDDLGELFTKTFHFSVKRFRIPEQQSFLSLETRIIQFIADEDSPSSLLIIYYIGDADPNLEGNRESVWAAYSTGEPTLHWHKIQPRFNDVKADVLLLLDCSFGAQAAVGKEGSNRVELLTASGRDGKASRPGPGSFTTAMIREIRQEVAVKGSATISKIHKRLSTGDARCRLTPFYVELAAGASERAIRLVPMRKDNLLPTDHGSDTSVHSRDIAYPESLDVDYAESKSTEGFDLDALRSIAPGDSPARKTGERSFFRHDNEDSSIGQALEDPPVNQNYEDSLVSRSAKNFSSMQEDDVSEVTSVKSLFSIPSLTSGETLSSVDSRQEMTGAAEEFAVIVLRDKVLEPLYREAFNKVTIEKFERNFTRLLRAFAVDLTQEAETINQKSAARFVRKRARDVATFVSKQYDPARDENSEQMLELILESPERQEMLERYLRQQCDHDTIPPDLLPSLGSTSKEEPEEDSGSDISDVERSHLRNLNDVKTFILGSSAFLNLRENLRRFLTGESGRPQPASTLGEDGHGKDESNDEDSEFDNTLEVLESQTEVSYVESTNLSSKTLRVIADLGRNIAEYLELREPVVKPEHGRIRWTCVCGARLFDDFQEITVGSLAQLETFLNDTRLRGVPNGTSDSQDQGNPASVAGSLSNQSLQTFQTARSNSNVSLHGNEPPAEELQHRGRGADRARQESATASAKFWILPIFQYQRYGTKVKHLHVDARMSDEALFRTAKANYLEETSRIRRFFALRGVKKISYVKFIHASREPDIHKYDDWPPEKYSKPKGEWIYKGCPAKKKHIPLVGHNYLMHLWQNPSHCDLATYRSRRSRIGKLLDYLRSKHALPSPESLGQRSPHQNAEGTLSDSSTARGNQAHPDNRQQSHTNVEQASIDRPDVATNSPSPSVEASQDQGLRSSYVFLRTPRKEGDQLMSDDESPPEAWGLYFEEGFRVHHCLILILFIYILASLAFGIYWCIKYGLVGPKSGAAAFGVSSWMIALVSLVTAVWFKWAD